MPPSKLSFYSKWRREKDDEESDPRTMSTVKRRSETTLVIKEEAEDYSETEEEHEYIEFLEVKG